MGDLIVNGVHLSSKEKNYKAPTDPLIQERLEWFKDQKLALMIHFGPYSQIGGGVDSSWPLSEADKWARKNVDWVDDLDEFREQYLALNKSFNPVRMQPDKWASFAAENGFKYMIFITKHHDGFCLYDSKYTDYKVTAQDCPFHTHKYANITKELFDAFRAKGIAIAAYFSKPDWTCPWYWAKGMEKPWGADRNPTYTPSEHPEIWEKFVEFTHGQMMELVEEYGRIDILWLDGGQVRVSNGQDIRLTEFIEKARKVQPWLISVNRSAGDVNENYITPEQTIPDHVINIPWESCITIGTNWIYSYSDNYKSSRTLVKMLIEIVSKGGNLALDIGPQPDGCLPMEAIREVEGLGAWLKVNGEAIYCTRPADIAQHGNIYYTKKGDLLYSMITLEADEDLKGKIFIPVDRKVNRVVCLSDDTELTFTQSEESVCVDLDKCFSGKEHFAVAFRFE